MNARQGLRAAMAEVSAYYKQRSIFQDRFGFGQRPVLVVIDMACGWTNPADAGSSARLDGAIDTIRQLLSVVREKRTPIVYITSPYTEQPPLKLAADFSPNFRCWNRRACAIDERLAPLSSEYFVLKPQTPTRRRLHRRQYTQSPAA
jgi:isochorismate hydrolase